MDNRCDLMQPLKLRCGAQLKNRIGKSAMSENMANRANRPHSGFDHLYNRRCLGGTGLLISGNIMVDSRACGEPHNVVIEPGNDCLKELKSWASAAQHDDCSLWAQLNHPGKQSPKFLSSQPVAPSAIGYQGAMAKMFNPPRALEEFEISDIISRFGYAAEQCKAAGFKGVQIHGAHGYLVSQFLSPLHNQRTDEWGGSIEGRMKFVRAVYQEIRSRVGPQFPIGIKLNSADFQRGGFSEEESISVVQALAGDGIDLIEISGGTYEAPAMTGKGTDMPKAQSTIKREAYFLDYCAKVRHTIDTPIMLTGGFRSRKGMTDALSTGACDVIGLARSLAVDPDFARKVLSGDEQVRSSAHPLSTGFKAIDKLFPLEITWYTQQLQRMAKRRNPDPEASVRWSVMRVIGNYGLDGLKRVRAN